MLRSKTLKPIFPKSGYGPRGKKAGHTTATRKSYRYVLGRVIGKINQWSKIRFLKKETERSIWKSLYGCMVNERNTSSLSPRQSVEKPSWLR